MRTGITTSPPDGTLRILALRVSVYYIRPAKQATHRSTQTEDHTSYRTLSRMAY